MSTPNQTPASVPPDDFFTEAYLPDLIMDENLGAELLESEAAIRARHGAYSGKIIDQNKARVDAIIAARSLGFGVRVVCKGFGLSPHSLAALELRHGQKIATLKDRLARKFGVFVELGLDRAIQEVDDMDIDKLLVSLGIATDKLLVMSGEPSSIIAHQDGPKQFTIEALRARLERREINVTGTGLGEGNSGATREGAAPAVAGLPNNSTEVNGPGCAPGGEGEK